jgi:hypothetical protein
MDELIKRANQPTEQNTDTSHEQENSQQDGGEEAAEQEETEPVEILQAKVDDDNQDVQLHTNEPEQKENEQIFQPSMDGEKEQQEPGQQIGSPDTTKEDSQDNASEQHPTADQHEQLMRERNIKDIQERARKDDNGGEDLSAQRWQELKRKKREEMLQGDADDESEGSNEEEDSLKQKYRQHREGSIIH